MPPRSRFAVAALTLALAIMLAGVAGATPPGNGTCCAAGPGFDMACGFGSLDIGRWPALIP